MKDRETVQTRVQALGPPEENVRCFSLMYAIENGIRELIIEELTRLEGVRWYKRRLPSDVLKKYRDAVQLQRQIMWTKLVPHHPIYYLDFPDLKKIIEREDNWKDAFSSIFARKDLISASLSEIEPVRNALAHNRKLVKQDVAMLEAALSKLASAVGMERFGRLASLTSSAHTIREDLDKLKSSLELQLQRCTKCEVLTSMEAWTHVKEQWWFDESYLGQPTEPIEKCFDLLTRYSELPRHRGCGHAIETWVSSSGLSYAVGVAVEVLRRLIDSV